jgi:hypothetical protein
LKASLLMGCLILDEQHYQLQQLKNKIPEDAETVVRP